MSSLLLVSRLCLLSNKQGELANQNHGLLFTLGVILWLLVGTLLYLETIGSDLGGVLSYQFFVFILAVFLLLFAMSPSVFLSSTIPDWGWFKLTQTGGYLPLFFLELATVVATPCMAPFSEAVGGSTVECFAFIALTFVVLVYCPILDFIGFSKVDFPTSQARAWMETLSKRWHFSYGTVAWLFWDYKTSSNSRSFARLESQGIPT